MIALTEEIEQMIRELFDARGTTEISADDLIDLLEINLNDIKSLLNNSRLENEFKLVQATDGTYFVQRLLPVKDVEKSLSSSFDIQWDTLGGCPCFTCYELVRCDIGNTISSVDCPLFAKWLFGPKEKKKKT